MPPPTPLLSKQYLTSPPPVAIGGIGGSGTRAIASILQDLGFFIGDDLNSSKDNLAFTLLLKQQSLLPLEQNFEEILNRLGIFLNHMYFHQEWSEQDVSTISSLASRSRFDASKEWLVDRVNNLLQARYSTSRPAHWGWKEPNTHIFLPVLQKHIPDLKYIHVMRHGMDMAFSDNQAQVHYWGESLTGETIVNVDPETSFRYWCAVHRRIASVKREMGDNFFLLNFDKFCRKPEAGLRSLVQFLEIDPPTQQLQKLSNISPPLSTGRHRNQTRIKASREDLRTLESLGFEIY